MPDKACSLPPPSPVCGGKLGRAARLGFGTRTSRGGDASCGSSVSVVSHPAASGGCAAVHGSDSGVLASPTAGLTAGAGSELKKEKKEESLA